MIADNPEPSKAIAVQAKRNGKVLDKVMEGQHNKETLTRQERAVLEAISDPQLYKATQSERMKAAGVGRRKYYQVINDPRFKEMQEHFVHAMLRERIGPIIGAAIDSAAIHGREGHQDRSMVLQMAGLHTPRKYVEQHLSGQVAIGIVGINVEDV